MAMIKKTILAAIAVLAIASLGTWLAFAYPNNNMMLTKGVSPPTQSIASISLSNLTFTNSTVNATVGTVSVTMSPASPAFSGTLSVTGTNSGGFHLVGTTLETNSAGTTSGTYSDVNIVATQAGISNSPQHISPTLTGSGGGGAICTGTPTPPGPAAAAGFTTLAACWDWTATSGNTMCFNGTCVPNTPLSNWLDCAGASNFQWSFGHNTPNATCGQIAVDTDPVKGNQVLDMVVTPNNGIATNISILLISCPNSTRCLDYPTTNEYVEINFRFDKEDAAHIPGGAGGMDLYSFWSNTGTVEIDFMEAFAYPATIGGGYGNWSIDQGVFEGGPNTASPLYDGNYHTLSNLATSNRTKHITATCWYVDGIARTLSGGSNSANGTQTCEEGLNSANNNLTDWCVAGSGADPNDCLQEGYFILANEGNGGGSAVTGNFHVYIAWMRVWSCAGWTTTPAVYGDSNTCSVTNPFTVTAP